MALALSRDAKRTQEGASVPNPTIAFYDREADSYVRSTLSNDLSALYPFLLDEIQPGGLILDAGCGSGRDILAFLDRGFEVEAFDASAEITKRATVLTGIEVAVARFEDWAAPCALYDGIWCFASLLHVRRPELPEVLRRLTAALRRGGALFASFKVGGLDGRDAHGRHYTNLRASDAGALFGAVPGLTVTRVWEETGPTGLGDPTTWLYVVGRRDD